MTRKPRSRERCITAGCSHLQHHKGTNIHGDIYYRRYCHGCHMARLAAKQHISVSEFRSSYHPYKKYRKEYCENAVGDKAGWLPVPCRVTWYPKTFLNIDHVDGNHHNNDPENLMTLCPTCHAVKTWIFDCTSHPRT